MKPDTDKHQTPAANPEAKAEAKPESKPESAPGSKPQAKQGSEPNAKPAAGDDLKTMPLADLAKKLDSSSDGLTQTEAASRLSKDGPNEIEEKKQNVILKFLSYFWGPIPWMIEAAVILSGVVRHWPDFFIILLLLLTNAVVGFWEEHSAGNAIAALKAKLATKTRVKRDGKWVAPPARELVTGDVIQLRLGDIVPADARLLDGDPMSVDQSALTGESLPASRKPGDAVYSGSIVRRGQSNAMVYATGTKTYFGKTAQLVEQAQTTSHFQKAVLKIGNYLIILAVVMVAVIITVAIFRGDPILTTLQFALVLTVAAIPVAMPTVLSVTMAVGARLLSKKKAIVSRLVAIEELAGVDVLCADKTGTLTQNKLSLGDPFCAGDSTPEQVVLAGALASRADNDDTIDLAVLGGLKDKDALKSYQVLHFTPFDPVHKRTEASVKGQDGNAFKVTKGAPQVILDLSANAAAVKDAVDKAVNDFAARGFRSLGVARADADGDWQLVGVLPLFDPPRDDAKATVATARSMGVKIKMVTGDALAIARETAKKLDMGTNILDGRSLGDSNKNESADVTASIESADGFAQVFPEHKFHIVDVLQKHGHIVGMTGDGVNDAPALKKADCGIAVSGATDAARAAASIVLTTPGLSVIIDAIKESRRIFQRMNSYAIYRIAETLRVLLFMTAAILIFNFYPLTAVMIVMLALLNDGAILAIAYDNVHYKDQPEAWNMRLVLGIATVLGLVGPIAAFGLFFLGDRVFHLDHAHLQPMMYLMLSVAGHLTIFQTRTRGPFWSIRPARVLWMAVLGTQIAATLIAVYGFLMPPLGWGWAGFVWAYALVWFFITDPVKLLAYKVLDRTKGKVKPETRAAAKPQAESEAQPETNAVPKSDVKPETEMKTKAKTKTAKPAPDAKPEAKTLLAPEAKVETKPDAKAQAAPTATAEETPEAKTQPASGGGAETKPAAKAEPAPDAKAEEKLDATSKPAPDAKAVAKPDAKKQPAPDAAAETKPDATAEPTPDTRMEAKPEATAQPAPDAKAVAKPDAEARPAPGPTASTKPGAMAQPISGAKPDRTTEVAGEAKTGAHAEVTPQLVKRVHALYEELGREIVQEVQESEKAPAAPPADKPLK
ncbi:MAG: plasma-membrane proton-efflux P-type ATPase [Rhodanobacter sp.]